MALPHYTYQDNRKNGTSQRYTKTTYSGTVTLDDLAEEIQTYGAKISFLFSLFLWCKTSI